MTYNLSLVKSANTLLELVTNVDAVTMGGLFAILLITIGATVAILNLQNFSGKEFFLFTGFFISIVSGLAWLSGLVHLYVFIVALIAGFIFVLLFFVTE